MGKTNFVFLQKFDVLNFKDLLNTFFTSEIEDFNFLHIRHLYLFDNPTYYHPDLNDFEDSRIEIECDFKAPKWKYCANFIFRINFYGYELPEHEVSDFLQKFEGKLPEYEIQFAEIFFMHVKEIEIEAYLDHKYTFFSYGKFYKNNQEYYENEEETLIFIKLLNTIRLFNLEYFEKMDDEYKVVNLSDEDIHGEQEYNHPDSFSEEWNDCPACGESPCMCSDPKW